MNMGQHLLAQAGGWDDRGRRVAHDPILPQLPLGGKIISILTCPLFSCHLMLHHAGWLAPTGSADLNDEEQSWQIGTLAHAPQGW